MTTLLKGFSFGRIPKQQNAACGAARRNASDAPHSTKELPNSRKRVKWGLTRREQELIPLIGRGLSNKEIANFLNLSEQTIKNHIHRILRKVGVPDRLSVFEACQMEALSLGTKNAGHSAQ